MAKPVFALGEGDAEYGKRLLYALNRSFGYSFSFLLFTSESALDRYASENQFDLLLLSDQMTFTAPDDMTGRVLLLTDDPAEGQQEGYLYRFQSVSSMMEKVFREYAVPDARRSAGQAAAGGTRVVGVYSPCGGTLKTTLTLVMGQYAARKGSALYITLEEYSALSRILGISFPSTLSDLLYIRRKEGSVLARLPEAVGRFSRLDVLAGVACPEDIVQGADVLPELIGEVAVGSGYDWLFLDLGNALGGALPLLRLCDRIVMPGREDAAAKEKEEAFRLRLMDEGEEDLLSRLIPVISPVPEYALPEKLFRSFPESPLSPAAQRILEEAYGPL